MVVVTGGTSGLGLVTAERFVAEGANVFITGRRQAELDSAGREIGRNAIGVQGDVSKGADLDRLFVHVKRTAESLDIVVANAGSGEFMPLGEFTERHYDPTLGVNFKGTALTVQKGLPLDARRRVDGDHRLHPGGLGIPAFGVYAATKAALRSFVRTWSVDLKARCIRVNVVSPVPSDTRIRRARHSVESIQPIISRMPLGRLGTTQDIANAVAFSRPKKAVTSRGRSCSWMAA